MSEYIEFAIEVGPSEKRRTFVWVVRNKRSGEPLGTIRWWGSWRQYTFHPLAATIFSHDCLTTIAEFCQKHTQVHRTATAWERVGYSGPNEHEGRRA